MSFIKDVIQNRKLIMTLAKNDFKTKFAGSVLGRIWAFAQPIVTVIVYWFVFELALNATSVGKAGINAPFAVWLVAGLVPWFFFQDILVGGSNSLIEYNYLVKKVVFNIDVLPIVKGVSAMFVHVIFMIFAIVFGSCFGLFPSGYTFLIIYFSICVFALAIGFAYLTSAIVLFFRDLSQIISILLQVLIWATPIMWNIDAMSERVPAALISFLKANPLYYVVSGYRGALIYKEFDTNFWMYTIYYWCWVVAVFIIGRLIFKKLKPHFADVL